jgi:hypothetical protein
MRHSDHKGDPIMRYLLAIIGLILLIYMFMDGLSRQADMYPKKVGRTIGQVLRDHGQKDIGNLRIVHTADNLITVHRDSGRRDDK